MFLKKKTAIILAAFLLSVVFTGTSHAVYFTLELKNGNEIITDHYSEDSSGVIHFYTDEGAVAIPKSTIKSIKSNDGSVEIDIEDEQQKSLDSNFIEESADEGVATPGENETKKDRINSINDQLFVINANLENLGKNKNIFISQQAQFQKQKIKSENRLMELSNSADADMKSTQDSIELEETKVRDLESKLTDIDQRLKNNEQIYEAQMRIKQRFDEDLKKKKKE